jgi:hypothetical protein
MHQSADHMRIGARKDFNNGTFRATSAIHTSDPYLHPVTVQDLLHLFLGQENVIALVGDQKAVAIAMTGHPALDEISGVSQLNVTFAVRLDLSIAARRRFSPSSSDSLTDNARAIDALVCGSEALRSMPRISSRLGMLYGYWLKRCGGQ